MKDYEKDSKNKDKTIKDLEKNIKNYENIISEKDKTIKDLENELDSVYNKMTN